MKQYLMEDEMDSERKKCQRKSKYLNGKNKMDSTTDLIADSPDTVVLSGSSYRIPVFLSGRRRQTIKASCFRVRRDYGAGTGGDRK